MIYTASAEAMLHLTQEARHKVYVLLKQWHCLAGPAAANMVFLI